MSEKPTQEGLLQFISDFVDACASVPPPVDGRTLLYSRGHCTARIRCDPDAFAVTLAAECAGCGHDLETAMWVIPRVEGSWLEQMRTVVQDMASVSGPIDAWIGGVTRINLHCRDCLANRDRWLGGRTREKRKESGG